MHETDHAVLEQVRRNLIDVLSLVLELFLERDKLATLGLPSWSVIDERFRQNSNLAASLDDIVKLRSMHDRVIHLVVFAILDACHSQAWHDANWHALLRVLSQSL